MIYYLVYYSAATHLFSEDDLADILTVSRRNNSNLHVTGILLYHEGSIIQVLEGEEETVKQLYKKIEMDDRHKHIIRMLSGNSEQRNFPDWCMGFKAVDADDWKEYEGYLNMKSGLLLSAIKHKNAKVDATIRSFVNTSIQQK